MFSRFDTTNGLDRKTDEHHMMTKVVLCIASHGRIQVMTSRDVRRAK